MYQLIPVIALISVAACSLPVHRPVRISRPESGLVLIQCEQSNLSAGLDLVGAAAGAVLWSVISNGSRRDDAIGGISTGLLVGSAVWGLVWSARCRGIRRSYGLPTHGELDWAVTPLIIVGAVFSPALDAVYWIRADERRQSIPDPD